MDTWSSPNHKSYMAITIHFEHCGEPFLILLDLVEVAESHTGMNLGNAFMTVLKMFGIDKKVRAMNNLREGVTHLQCVPQILGITSDNTSNNDAMIKYLGNTLDEFPGPANQTWCFVHTINLIARSILKPFEEPKKKDVQAFNDMAKFLSNSAEGAAGNDLDKQPVDKEGHHGDDNNNTIDNELNASLKPIRAMLQKVCLHS